MSSGQRRETRREGMDDEQLCNVPERRCGTAVRLTGL
jgi:hypothetical protein